MSDIVWGKPFKPEKKGVRPRLVSRTDMVRYEGGVPLSASEWRWDTDNPVYQLRIDHPYYAQRRDTESVAADPEIQKMMADAAKGCAVPVADDWKPDPRTVMACIEAVRPEGDWSGEKDHELALNFAVSRIKALLPKPDPAKALVEEYRQTFKNPDIVATHMDDETAFAEWLVSTGRLQP